MRASEVDFEVCVLVPIIGYSYCTMVLIWRTGSETEVSIDKTLLTSLLIQPSGLQFYIRYS